MTNKELILIALGQASVAWDSNRVFDSEQCINIANRLEKDLANNGPKLDIGINQLTDFEQSIKHVRVRMNNDTGLHIVYQSNIAMCIHDNPELNNNELSDKLMLLLFPKDRD